jgi:nuclease S1
MRHRFSVTAISLCAVLGASGPSYAWGPKGHRIVAIVAEAHLTEAAKQGVRDLLDSETDPRVTSLPDAAIWPDLIKADRPETKPWHFVDVLISAPGKPNNRYDQARDCAGEECIVPKIAALRATLKDSSASMADRLEALKFITHFIGDLHQPLHCADNHDRGGNDVNVKFFGKKMNLHSLWDTGVIEHAGLDEHSFASELLDNLDATKIPALQAGKVVDWTNASHALAKAHAYKLPTGSVKLLGQAYYNANADTVDEQLTKAGLRLARILNESFPSARLTDRDR